MLSDWLAAEELIVDRLKDQVAELRTVTTAAELAAVAEMRQKPTPSAIVVYDGDDVPTNPQSQAKQGARHKAVQRWLVVLAVKNVADQRAGSSARRDAGPLIAKIMNALAGWQLPLPGVRPLSRAGSPGPAFEKGYGYFPILFTAEVFQ